MSNTLDKNNSEGYSSNPSVSIKRGRWINTSLKYVLSACTASFILGYQISVFNTIKDFVSSEFQWCSEKDPDKLKCEAHILRSSLILASVFIGAVLGSGFSGYLVKFGRRFALLVIYYFFIVISILTSISRHFDTLFFARLLAGIGIGFITVAVPMYISEMTHKDKKGAYGVLHQLFITIGIFVGLLLGMPMGKGPTGTEANYVLNDFQKVWWRIMFAIPACISLLGITCLIFFFKEESPYFLYEQGKIEESKKVLKKIYETEDVDETFHAIKEAIEQNENARKNSLSLYKAFTIPCYRKVIILGCVLSSFQQMTGVNVLMANSNELYKNISNENITTILSTLMAALNCVMTLPAIYIVEKLGRKTLLLFGCFAIIVAYLPTAIANIISPGNTYVDMISIVATFVMITAFSVSYGPVLWVYLHEMFPSEIKDSAAGLASLINWLCAIIVVFPSDALIKKSVMAVFIIFAVMSIISFLFVLFFIKETKGGEIGTSPYVTMQERKEYLTKFSLGKIQSGAVESA